MSKSIKEIKQEFDNASFEEKEQLCRLYEEDSRSGVQALIRQVKKAQEKLQKEYDRLEGMTEYEKKYPNAEYICGIDEAGRGPLAGPVVAGAVVLPKDSRILYLNDSKKLTPARREELYDVIMEEAVSVGVGIVDAQRIDEINILQATYEAMRQAISKLSVKPDVLLNDAVRIPGVDIMQVPIIKGDAKSLSIAAASVIAKVTRDRMMQDYDQIFPGYGFAQNKGYGTQGHMDKLKADGPSPIHRATFIGGILSGEKKKTADHHARGTYFETGAAAFLEKNGYEILVRNYRCVMGEVDMIGKDGDTYAFVEVKYRADKNMGSPQEAVDEKKQQRIIRCAQWYLMENNLPQDTPVRFDVVSILAGDMTLDKNAFTL
ncbi:MAG TPA: ribonuclease HII [Candidatus Scybalocola faecavium]|nr:ribonuclease HII [Candidatus Scybalocola faecavium]